MLPHSSGSLEVEQLPNGNWMFSASMNDGIHFQVGIEADEMTARRRGQDALEIQRRRRTKYEENA